MEQDRPACSAMDRRRFLKRSAMGVGLAAWLAGARKALAESFAGWPERFGVLVDLVRCNGCRRCEAACNKVNELPPPPTSFEDKSVFERRRRTDPQTYTVVNRYPDPRRLGEPVYRKVQCMHCEEPACVAACLVGAMKKTPEGAVIWDEAVCLGCRYCINACPFSIPTFEYDSALTPRVRKCVLCYTQRIAKGEVPACVAECPLEALAFGKRSELIKLAQDRIRDHPGKYLDHIYGEREAGGTSWLYISGVPFAEVGLPGELGTTAYPELTREFLSFVPLVLVVWPPLLGGFYLFSKRREQSEQAEAPNHQEKPSC